MKKIAPIVWTRLFLYTFILVLLSLLCSCDLPGPGVPDPGVVISWDIEGYDRLEDLYNIRTFVNDLGVPFTFYIRTPEPLAVEQVDILTTLEADGHEIGYHTCYHTDAIKYILIEKHTIEEYVNYEILPGIEDFQNNGITIKSFAYPVAHHFTALDNYLLEHYFDSLRSVSPVIDWCYYKGDSNRVISAYWIDDLEIVSEDTLLKKVRQAMKKAKQRNFVLNLYGHNININERHVYTTKLSKLEKMIDYAKKLGLTFYRMEDLFSTQ